MNKKYFTFWHIALSSVLSTPIAGLYMIASNFYFSGKLEKALASLFFGILFIIIYLLISNIFFDGIPIIFHLIIPTLLLLFFAYKVQPHIEKGIMEGRYLKNSYLSVSIVCVMCWVLIALFSYIYIAE